VGAIFYSRLLNFSRILYAFVLFLLVVEIVARILFELGMNNMFIFHVYSFGEVAFLSLIYRNLSNSQRWKKIILSGFLLFQTLSIINLLFLDDITHFNSVQRYFEMFFIFVLLAGYIVQGLGTSLQKRITNDPAMVLTLGLLIYFWGTFYLFIFGKEILSDAHNNYWIIHGIFNIFLNGVYAVVFWKACVPKNAHLEF